MTNEVEEYYKDWIRAGARAQLPPANMDRFTEPGILALRNKEKKEIDIKMIDNAAPYCFLMATIPDGDFHALLQIAVTYPLIVQAFVRFPNMTHKLLKDLYK
jgi:hypothetical protein